MKKEKRDILFLLQYFYPEYISSATLPFDTAIELSKYGFKVSVVCGYPKEYIRESNVKKNENYKGILIKRLNYLQLNRSSIYGRLVNQFSFTFSVFLNFLNLRNHKVVLVYSNPPILPIIAILARKIFKSKIVFVCYDVYPEIAIKTNSIKENSIMSKFMYLINTSLYKNAKKVVALSYDMKEFISKNRVISRETQIEVIPNWFEDNGTKNIEDILTGKQFNDIRENGKFVVSYFGNMGIAQDLNTLIEAIKILRNQTDIMFLFAGHGNKLSKLIELVRIEKFTNVKILDFLHGKEYQDALNISDVFIVTLEKGLVGLAVPSKTYSYMSTGKPIIAIMETNSDISKDLIDNNAGYAIEVGEVEKLVSSILSLKNDKNKTKEMALNIRSLFEEKYTKAKSTSKYVELINEILEVKNV